MSLNGISCGNSDALFSCLHTSKPPQKRAKHTLYTLLDMFIFLARLQPASVALHVALQREEVSHQTCSSSLVRLPSVEYGQR